MTGSLCGKTVDDNWSSAWNSGNKMALGWWKGVNLIPNDTAWGVGTSKRSTLTPFQNGGSLGAKFKALIDEIPYASITTTFDWSNTYYLDQNCNVLPANAGLGKICGTTSVRERWGSPISLVLNPNKALSGKLASFQLNPFREETQQVQWFGSADSPLLVLDPTHKGEIRDGSQLFGTYTFSKEWNHGYEALATIDKDRDGKVSGSELEPLGVWIDRDQDAVSQPGEVVSAAAFGIEELYVKPDVEQKELDKGFLWATKGFSRVIDGKRETLPTVDWFSPEGSVAAHIAQSFVSSGGQKSTNTKIDESVASTSDNPRLPTTPKSVSAINKDTPFEVWRWGIGESPIEAPANQGGWLTFQRDEQGNLVVLSVVVAPLKENDRAPNFAALTTLLIGNEEKQKDGSKVVEFSGRRKNEDDPQSGFLITTKAVISANGKTMQGETSQEPYGKSNSRNMRYSWKAVSLGTVGE